MNKKANEIDAKAGLFACNVILSKGGIIQENYLVVANENEVGEKAESLFQKKIEEHADKWSLIEDEVEAAKEEGYYQIPHTDYEIFLTWPTVEDGRE